MSNNDYSSNALLLKQQGIVKKEHTNQRKPLLTVASFVPRRDSSISNEYIFHNNVSSSQVTTELGEQNKETQLNHVINSRIFKENTIPIKTEVGKEGDISGHLDSGNMSGDITNIHLSDEEMLCRP